MSHTPSSGQARINSKRAQRAALWTGSGAPVTPQVVWTGQLDHSSDYQTHVIAWLLANGIEGQLVDACQSITVAAGEIRYTRILLNADGKPYAALPGVPATSTGVAPLLVPFETPETP